MYSNGSLRLTRTEDFKRVARQGRAQGDHLLLLRAAPNGLGLSRIGFSVGKPVGKAVARNRIRRRLREAVRHAPVVEGWDVVITARKGAAMSGFRELEASLLALMGRLGLVTKAAASREAKA